MTWWRTGPRDAGFTHPALHDPGGDQRRYLEQVTEDLLPLLHPGRDVLNRPVVGIPWSASRPHTGKEDEWEGVPCARK